MALRINAYWAISLRGQIRSLARHTRELASVPSSVWNEMGPPSDARIRVGWIERNAANARLEIRYLTNRIADDCAAQVSLALEQIAYQDRQWTPEGGWISEWEAKQRETAR